ncbi:extracellular calcium-sensing receptor-like [Pleurodeles waltl]|uniref:extracellular calcium-sensing receptor-like n=1 Tax=Pleurodeles waltl TaxID=8319 RepID=UPI003709823F
MHDVVKSLLALHDLGPFFRVRSYRWVQALIFAVQQINHSSGLLPNTTLGFIIHDSCGVIVRALEGTVSMLTGEGEPVANYRCHHRTQMVAVIGDASSLASVPMARVLGLHRYPQISYGATVPLLKDKHNFPSFLRTMPNDEVQSRVIALLVARYKWNWVGILAEENDYGLQGSQILKEELERAGICTAFYDTLPTVYSSRKSERIISTIQTTTANAIIIFSSDDSLFPFMEDFSKQTITKKIWIASDGWSVSPIFGRQDLWQTLQGTIGLVASRGDMPGFKEHVYGIRPDTVTNDVFIHEFWEDVFACRWSVNHTTDISNKGALACTGSENLQDVSNSFFDFLNLRNTYATYNAVYAIAHALQDLDTCKDGKGPFLNGTCASLTTFEPWQLLHYLKRVRFRNPAGAEVFFDKYGDPPGQYDIVNWQLDPHGDARYITVGHFDASASNSSRLVMNDSLIFNGTEQGQIPQSKCSDPCRPGHRRVTRPGLPICCFDCIMCSEGEISNQTDGTECLKCPEDQWANGRHDACIPKTVEFLSYRDGLGSTLAALSVISGVFPVVILVVFIKNRDTPVVKANNRDLSYLLLVALSLCFLCSLIFIGKPQHITCILRQTAFGVAFAFCVSCVFAKTILVVVAFKSTLPNSSLRKWIGYHLPNAIIIISTFVQVLICAVWLAIASPFPQTDMTSHTGVVSIYCHEGLNVAFWLMLGYLGFLASISFLVAFLARKLPDSFNEAKYITFSMLVFVSVWLSFIPAYVSTKGKYMVAVEIFAILSSSHGLLWCIFMPKCYIILFRPHMNSKDYVSGKRKTTAKKNA